MRRLCLIISVIPAAAAAAGFDVPAVDLNRGRFPSHPPSASQPGRRQRQQRLHTPLGHTRTHTLSRLAHTQLFYLRGKVLTRFCVFVASAYTQRRGTLNWQSIHQCVIYLREREPPWPVWC